MMQVVLARKTTQSQRVVELELRPLNGTPLPDWEPGAHLDLHLPEGLIRQYSLCDAVPGGEAWRVCVSLDPQSRGGSRAVHEMLQPGEIIEVSEPRNNFPFRPGTSQVFVAGGIGLTPLRAMITQAEAAGGDWELHYGVASRTELIHPEWLDSLGQRVHLYFADTDGFPDLTQILADRPQGVQVYACGPSGMLDAVQEAAAQHGIEELYTELFSADPVDTSGSSFEVRLERSDLTFTVDEGQTIMAVAEENGFEFPRSCEDGICGSCITDVLEGVPESRDHVLTDEEIAEGKLILPCVSRAKGRLVLDC